MDSANDYGSNFGLKDEIKAYWSARAATFDLSPGHEIFSEDERAAWHRLVLKHLGPGEGRLALDLASGTGVVSHLMDDLGFRVTGLDWAEPMLERAKAKRRAETDRLPFVWAMRKTPWSRTRSYDVVINRHLVWTLVDPKAAFREWMRVLKPGGQVLIVDGDFVNVSRMEKVLKDLANWLQRRGLLKAEAVHMPPDMAGTHNSILSRVYFSNGARAEAVAALLRDAGFEDVTIDTDLRDVHKSQAKNWNVLKAAARGIQHRYAICARKPG